MEVGKEEGRRQTMGGGAGHTFCVLPKNTTSWVPQQMTLPKGAARRDGKPRCVCQTEPALLLSKA